MYSHLTSLSHMPYQQYGNHGGPCPTAIHTCISQAHPFKHKRGKACGYVQAEEHAQSGVEWQGLMPAVGTPHTIYCTVVASVAILPGRVSRHSDHIDLSKALEERAKCSGIEANKGPVGSGGIICTDSAEKGMQQSIES